MHIHTVDNQFPFEIPHYSVGVTPLELGTDQ